MSKKHLQPLPLKSQRLTRYDSSYNSVLHCGDDVLDQECDMPTVHHHLTNLPQTIDFASNLQKIMDSASLLFRKHPPSYLAGKNSSYETKSSILSGFDSISVFGYTFRALVVHFSWTLGALQVHLKCSLIIDTFLEA